MCHLTALTVLSTRLSISTSLYSRTPSSASYDPSQSLELRPAPPSWSAIKSQISGNEIEAPPNPDAFEETTDPLASRAHISEEFYRSFNLHASSIIVNDLHKLVTEA
ncbi:hypothetical protein EI94DRAFT_1836225, partial [Lactarius quietus]